jgi:uncharacterized membrane protein YeaQ/YmgE (transglycosylase-associated protein family)
MTTLELIVYLVIAAVCGAIARSIAGGTAGGFILSILVGFLGAFVGTWLARMFRLPEVFAVNIGGHPFPIFWSILGGVALVALGQLLTRPSFRSGGWQVRH